MNDLIRQYFSGITKRYNAGNSTEHTFRGDLQNLLEKLVPNILATNEPSRIACGAPDYIIQRKDIPLGYIEAKDIGIDLNKTEKSDQLKRYKASLDNLILTDYLEFRFYRYGEKVNEIKIAEVQNGKIKLFSNNYEHFVTLITDFCSFKGQTIKSASKLAKMMAQKARMMEEVICKAVGEKDGDNTLHEQLKAFKNILIHDLDDEKFADIYAQTIAYGLFAARLNDSTLEDFSRQEALFLVPKSNPFLRQLFTYVAGPDLDDRVVWIVNDLADIFQAIDLKELLNDFGKSTQQNDPFIHFYETFLAEYNPKLRKSRGVYYTPEPVVNFIVRAVDDILKTEFGLSQGLADTSKVKIKVGEGKDKQVHEVHKVQILDPAVGTGTFLAEVIKQIHSKFEGQEGIWNNYVKDHLIPRLNGFEILMASYAIAHLKLDMLLRETGYVHKSDERFRIYLTNSLEEAHPDTGTLFASWLSHEASEANYIKRDTPVMIIVGNPPYSVSSKNNGNWIKNLISDYKANLNESNKNSLSDDYVKFIRYGQHYIDKNGQGVLAFITNNSFINGKTHRQMRSHLKKTFNKIVVIDLHGSAKKREVSPDGSKDENVFDIQQGVSIFFLIKLNNKETSNIFHADLFGTREYKYEKLKTSNLSDIGIREIKSMKPYHFFTPFNYAKEKEYNKLLSLDQIFLKYGSGIKFRKDNLLIKPHFNFDSVVEMLIDMDNLSNEEILSKYNINNTADWEIGKKRIHFSNAQHSDIKNVQYRLFDYRYTYYPYEKISEIIVRGDSRRDLMKNLFSKDNMSLLVCKQQSSFDFQHIFISRIMSDMCTVSAQSKESNNVFPLYLYDYEQIKISRIPNFNITIVEQFTEAIGHTFTPEKEQSEDTVAPIDILDYIYAILHNPTYREKYKEFLKIDFPRVPYPKDKETFWQFVKLGGELRQIHLLESPVIEKFKTTYPNQGDNTVVKPKYENNKVWINAEQHFANVPQVAWEFYIGGYQPAQKWLKDRKKRELKFEDIQHYQKIIVALTETDRIMKEIDKIGVTV